MLIRAPRPGPRAIEDLLSAAFTARLDRLDLASRKVFAGKMAGERRSKQRGRSVEFADYREYSPGDDIRFIDWHVYGRFDRLVVKLFFEEQDLGLHVAVDASASMLAGTTDDPASISKAAMAQRVAAALGYVGLANNNRVSMSVFGPAGAARLGETRGKRNIRRVADFLLEHADPARVAAGAGGGAHLAGGFARAMRGLASTRRGRGVLVVISDFLFPEGYEDGLRWLAAGSGGGASFDVFALQVLAPGEVDPGLEARGRSGAMLGDLRLIDVESGAGVETTVTAALLERYKERVKEYVEGLAAYCSARRIAYVRLMTDAQVETAVLETLRGRGLVG